MTALKPTTAAHVTCLSACATKTCVGLLPSRSKLAGVAPGAREALARSVLQDVGERPGDLALVQFALTATWQHRNEYGGDLLQSYTGIGRAEGALARAAENVYADKNILGGDAKAPFWQ
jgi:hypothetical protein